jgi:epoxyqueuosine reductase
LERDFATLAGLGWIGKNTLLLNRHYGSWLFLAALLTDVELAYTSTVETDHCGTCTACLQACPTQAFPQPYVLDATRCISYLTIELRGAIAPDLRTKMGDWLFGCDVCQDVCPWNHRAPRSMEDAFAPTAEQNPIDLIGLFELDEAAFRRRFRHKALWRAGRSGLLRNAAIALGNARSMAALPALRRGLRDSEPIVRGACAWALGQFGHRAEVAATLREQLAVEEDPAVVQELEAALESGCHLPGGTPASG